MKNLKEEISRINFHDASLELVSWQNDKSQNDSGEIRLLIVVGGIYELLTLKFGFLTEFAVHNVKSDMTHFVLEADFDIGLGSIFDESGDLNGFIQEYGPDVENYLSVKFHMNNFSDEPEPHPYNQAFIQLTGVNIDVSREK